MKEKLEKKVMWWQKQGLKWYFENRGSQSIEVASRWLKKKKKKDGNSLLSEPLEETSPPDFLLFSCSVVSNSLWPHVLQPGFPVLHHLPDCSNLCPLSWWCHPTLSSSVVFLLLPSVFPSIRAFSNESALHIRWPKYWLWPNENDCKRLTAQTVREKFAVLSH